MKRKFTLHLFILVFVLIIGTYRVSAQTATAVVYYTGAQSLGCCTVCGEDYWCINDVVPPGDGLCGTANICDSRTFTDPVPAGNIATNIVINYWSAGCYGNTISGTINGNTFPTVNEANTGCFCSNNPCAMSATTNATFPCGISNYNYNGALNTLELCCGADICMQRVEIVVTYVPSDESQPPQAPGAISGNSPVCDGSPQTYSIAAVSGAATYTWTVPALWTITSGQGTTSINVTAAATSGDICVTPSNLCGTSGPACFPVVGSAVPVAPTSCNVDNNNFCQGAFANITLSAIAGSGTTLNWYSGSCGGTYIGTGTPLTISAPTTTTTYYANWTTLCGTSACASITVIVNPLAVTPTSASVDNTNFCQGTIANIDLTAVGGSGSTLDWSTSCGGAVIGTGSPLTIASPATTTTYYAWWNDGCGNSGCSNVTVNVDPLPVAPTLASVNHNNFCPSTFPNMTLTATGGSGTTLNWYSGSCGGTYVGSGTNLTIASPMTTTTYYAMWTNGCGNSTCASITVVITSTATQPATLSVDNNNFCMGDFPTITLSAVGGGGVSLNWYTGSCHGTSIGTGTPLTITAPTTSTTYYAAWSDACGVSTCASIPVTVNPLPTISNVTGGGAYCSGGSGVLVGLSGSQAGVSYQLQLGGVNTGSPVIGTGGAISFGNQTSAGIYTVVATTGFGCKASMPGSATVIINSNPVANSGSNISIPNGSFTVLNGSATGGTGNYNYNWSPSNMVVNANIPDPQTVNLSASQVYTLLVTDAITGCTSTSLVSVFVTGSPFSVITSTSLPTPDICLGNSTQLICTPTGGTGNYTYSWVSSPTGFTSSTQNPIVSPTSTTTYTVTVSDGFNNATSSVMVTVYSLPIANAGSNVSICNGTSTTLNASGGTSYSWSPGTGLSSTTGANPVSSPTTSTTYIVTVTNNNGCTATADVNVSVFSQVPANAGPAQTICDGQEAFLNSSGGVVFNWSPSTGLSSITISNPVATPTSTTTYTVVTTDGNGCTSSSDVVITVKPGVTANAGTDTSICLGASANLFASGGIIYSWSPANGLNSVSISNPIATPQYTTTYVVTVSNSSGCSATDAVTVNIVAAPTTTVSPNTTICSGANVTLNATGGTTYSWSPAASLNATNIPDPIAYPASTTTYTVTVTGSAGCFATNNVTITVNQSPNVNIGNPVTICNTQSTTLSASGGAVYTWSNGANTATNIVSPSSTTLYTVTVSNANGCSVKDTITVSVKPYQLPVITADGPTTFCNGAPVNVVLDANSGFTSYMWSNGSTGQSLNVTSAGLYYVTGNTANGCSGKSNTISVNSYPASTVPVVITADGTTKFCEGDTISVNLYTTSSYFAYAWSSGSNTPAIHVTHAGYYQLTVSDSNGCPDTSNIIQVQFLPKPVAYINYNQHGTFVTFANYSINTTSYFWSFGDGITSMLPSPTHTYDSTGIYHVIFVATNVCGSDTIKLTLNISTGEGIVPNNFVRNLIVFPVPTKDILTVSFDFSSTQNVEIKMLNTLGQLLYDETPISITGKYEKVFDMSSYSKGVYYLQIKTNKGIVNKEIVVD